MYVVSVDQSLLHSLCKSRVKFNKSTSQTTTLYLTIYYSNKTVALVPLQRHTRIYDISHTYIKPQTHVYYQTYITNYLTHRTELETQL